MTKKKQDNVSIKELSMQCYKLDGASHKAALELSSLVHAYFEQDPVALNGRNMGDIQKDYRARSDFMLAEIARRAPDLFEACGLNAQTVQIHYNSNGKFHRAYARFPDIVAAPTKEPEFYMYVPVDYKGRHFVPADAKLLNKQETDRAGDLLFAGGWLGNGPILKVEDKGVAIPSDFVAKSDRVQKGDSRYGKMRHRYFKAEGESLAFVEDYDSRRAAVSASFQALCDHIRAIMPDLQKSGVFKGVSGEGYNPSFMMGRDANGRPELEFSIRAEGRHNIMMGGQPTTIAPTNDYFDIVKDRNGRNALQPHTRTPQAKVIYDLVQAIPNEPSYADYAALIYHEDIKPVDQIDSWIGASRLPVVRKLPEGVFLDYRVNKGDKIDFNPPGAIEIPAQAFLWAEADKEDRNRGITPPPRPDHIAELEQVYAQARARMAAQDAPVNVQATETAPKSAPGLRQAAQMSFGDVPQSVRMLEARIKLQGALRIINGEGPFAKAPLPRLRGPKPR